MEPVGVLLVLFAMLAVLLLRTHLTTSCGRSSTESTRDQTVVHCRPLWWPIIDPPVPRATAPAFDVATFLP